MSSLPFATLRRSTLLAAALAAIASPSYAADPPAPAAAPAPPPTTPTAAPPAAATPPPTPAPAATAPAAPAAPATPPAPTDAPPSATPEGDTEAEEADADESPEKPAAQPDPSLLFTESKPQALVSPPAAERAEPDDGLFGTHQEHWLLSVGLRVGFIPTVGYDPFSENNGFTQFSLGLGRTVMTAGKISTAASLLWDWGSAEGTARGAKTTLTVNRLTLGLEGRYHVLRRLYAFGRVAPGALRSDATLMDGGAGVEREAGDWVIATDLSAGAAFEFAGQDRGQSKLARGWVSVDGGYGWAASSSLLFVPTKESEAPARLQPVDFGDLAFRGAFLRLAAALTY